MNGRIALWRMALISAVGLLSLGSVQAEEPNPPGTESGTQSGTAFGNAPSFAGPAVRPLLGLGLTFGGDTLATTFFENGDQTDIKAGQLLQLYGGLEYRATALLSVQATVGHHFHNSSASNGSVRFARIPVELLGHFHTSDKWQFGGGLRLVSGPKLSGSGAASSLQTVEFDNTTGIVVEGEYRTNSRLGFKLRYVSEKYDTKPPFAATVDGSHIGLLMNWYL